MTQNRKNTTSYGLYCYDTVNIGDEIQSIAAKRFLPKVDLYINRDSIDHFISQNNSDNIKLIMNGWYLEHSLIDDKIHWPPQSPNLHPLLISMHISFLNNTTNLFKSENSLNFLRQNGPVGARDMATYEYLQSVDVPSYFSGCLTLTLLPDKNIKKSNFILAADVDDETYTAIKQRTTRPVIRINSIHSGHFTMEQKFALAKYWLTLYQSAHLVITTRLHAMLPCLALDTPVIALPAPDSERFTGLIELTNHYEKSEFIHNKIINLDEPRKNPSTYKKLRDLLVKKCTTYTGYDSKNSYLGNDSIEKFYSDPSFIEAVTSTVQTDYISQQQLDSQNHTIENLNQQLDTLKNPGIKNSTRLLLKAIKNHF